MTKGERIERQLKQLPEAASERELWLMERQAYAKELHRMAREDFDASLMSNTKWAELVEGMRDLRLRYRIKFIDSDEILEVAPLWIAAHGYLEGGGTSGPEPLIAVEWLEILTPINPSNTELVPPDAISCQAIVRQRLEQINVAFHEQNGVFRILGHMRFDP